MWLTCRLFVGSETAATPHCTAIVAVTQWLPPWVHVSFRQSISHHGLERGRWSIIAVSPNSVVLETISPFCTVFFTSKGIYLIGLTSWLFVLCGVISTQSPIISYQILLYVHLTIKCLSSVQRLIVRYKKKNRFSRL